MPNCDEDIALMLKVKVGDISAFEQIMKKHEKPVINTIYRFVGNRARAEEIAQEAFIRVYRSASKYRPNAKFSTWLYKIVTNICLDDIRKKKDASDLSFNNEILYPGQSSQSLLLERKRSNCLIREAIYSLPKRQRIAVILREYNGLSYKEISKILKSSPKAVESLLYHAKLGLKEKLLPYFEKGEI
jgi:RNA polymerase sigma-70 factor (ECF subfamily)